MIHAQGLLVAPTSPFWLNQVERFAPSERQIKRGAHKSVKALIKDIESFLDAHNANPEPLPWIKSVDDILASIERFRTLDAHAAGR